MSYFTCLKTESQVCLKNELFCKYASKRVKCYSSFSARSCPWELLVQQLKIELLKCYKNRQQASPQILYCLWQFDLWPQFFVLLPIMNPWDTVHLCLVQYHTNILSLHYFLSKEKNLPLHNLLLPTHLPPKKYPAGYVPGSTTDQHHCVIKITLIE